MLVDAAETTVLSNLGWVDRGSILTLDVASRRVTSVPVGEGDFLRLLPGEDDLFACVLMGYKRVPWIAVTVRHIADPAAVLAEWQGGDAKIAGDRDVWSKVPRLWVGYDRGRSSYVALSLDPATGDIAVHALDWFDDAYDQDYQEPMTVTALPGSSLWLFSVARSSDLVLYDPVARRVARKVRLAGRGGNPEPHICRTRPEVWATDYDSLVRLDVRSWKVKTSKRLQGAGFGSMLFIGSFAFDRDEQRCAIARPYSGDVVVIDANSWKQLARVALGRRPLDVALLSDGSVFARDWQTGDVLAGRM